MIPALIAPLTLPTSSPATPGGLGGGERPRPAVPSLPEQRVHSFVYDLATMDQWGRVIARSAIAALGWQPGTRLCYTEHAGLVLVVGDDGGDSEVSRQGHLRLPFPLRQWGHLTSGTRMLVVADPAEKRLVLHLPIVLDAMVSLAHARLVDGGPA